MLLNLGGIRNASLESDSQGKFDITLNRRVRDMESEELFLREALYSYRNNGENKSGFKWKRHGIVIGRFGRKFALVYDRWNSGEVDLNDLAPSGMIFDALGCDGALNLHWGDRQFHIRYLVGPETLVFLTKIRNGIL